MTSQLLPTQSAKYTVEVIDDIAHVTKVDNTSSVVVDIMGASELAEVLEAMFEPATTPYLGATFNANPLSDGVRIESPPYSGKRIDFPWQWLTTIIRELRTE